jgi:membrane protein implicated in regulation of membrane protease activity
MTTRLIPLIAAAALALLPGTAFAYVGPGAGLTMIGALWAVILALFAALFFAVAWPVRRMLRRARLRRSPAVAATPKARAEAGDGGGTSKAA